MEKGIYYEHDELYKMQFKPIFVDELDHVYLSSKHTMKSNKTNECHFVNQESIAILKRFLDEVDSYLFVW